jgi:hypothetical protein
VVTTPEWSPSDIIPPQDECPFAGDLTGTPEFASKRSIRASADNASIENEMAYFAIRDLNAFAFSVITNGG